MRIVEQTSSWTLRFTSKRSRFSSPVLSPMKGTHAAEYHSKDFEFDDVVRDGKAFDMRMLEAMRSAVDHGTKDTRTTNDDDDKWNEFYAKHGVKFYKEKRYIPQAFKELLSTDGHRRLRVLTVGCGTGAGVVAAMKANERLDVCCSDRSSVALRLLRRRFGSKDPKISAEIHVTTVSSMSLSLTKSIVTFCDSIPGSAGWLVGTTLERRSRAGDGEDWTLVRASDEHQILCVAMCAPTTRDDEGTLSVTMTCRKDTCVAVICEVMRCIDDVARARQCGMIKYQALPRFPAIEAFLAQHKDRLVRRSPCSLFALPDDVVSSRVNATSDAIKLAPLRIMDAGIVNKTWTYNRAEKTLPLVRSMIKSKNTMAAFDNDDRPVSWALQYPNGGWGMLYTIRSHRRRGLALRVVDAFLRHMRVRESRVFNFVVEGNTASEKLCSKVGLRKSSCAVDWIFMRVRDAEEISTTPRCVQQDLSKRVRYACWDVAANVEIPTVVRTCSGKSGFDFVLLIFVLSAIHPRDHVRALSRIRSLCRSDSKLCFRDYALYDMTMLRSRVNQIVNESDDIVAPRLFRREDGTLRYFFDLATMERTFCRAGWELVRGREYCRVINRNRKTGAVMRRVFVNAVFRPFAT